MNSIHRKIKRPFLHGISVCAAVLLSAGASDALAYRLAGTAAWTATNGNATNAGGTASFSIVGGSGLLVTVNANASAATNKYIGIGQGSTGPSGNPFTADPGIQSTWFTPNLPVASTNGFYTVIGGRTTWDASVNGGGTNDPACVPGTPVGTLATCHATTLTISFPFPVTNPTLHVVRLGGFVNQLSPSNVAINVWETMQITTPGATLTLLSGNGQLAVNGGNTITYASQTAARAIDASASCTATGGGLPTGCGSVRVNGTFQTLTFNVNFNALRQAGTGTFSLTTLTYSDGVLYAVTVPEDYGDAPNTYENPAPAASHVLTDLKLGVQVGAGGTANADDLPNTLNSGAINTNPYNDPTAASDSFDDSLSIPASLTPASNISTVAGTQTTVAVSLSGASLSGKVCGWLDFNKNGVFDTATEAAPCQSFAAGASSVNLVFTTPAGISAQSPSGSVSTTLLRVRASYDSALSATTPSGLVNSGEVEDYSVTLADKTNVSVTKDDASLIYTPGGTGVYTITVSNSGPDGVLGLPVSDALPKGLTITSAGWTCAAVSGGASCSSAGGGANGAANFAGDAISNIFATPQVPAQLTVNLPANSSVKITVPVTFAATPSSY